MPLLGAKDRNMSVVLKSYLLLFLAVGFETMATSCLKSSQQFTRPLPTVLMAVGYVASFYCLSLVLKHMALGVAYAIWCALGMVLVAVIGTVAFKQRLDAPAMIGIAFIVIGVIIINLFSKAVYQS